MAKTATQKYLETFFEEKNVPSESWSVVDADCLVHVFSSEVVIEAILGAPDHEQEQIADILRKIDFHNGDVNHFLKHLSQALAENY